MSLPFQPQYPIILQPSGGDLDNQVFTKTKNEFSANYNEHQSIATWYESSTAPLNPVLSQKWKDTSTTPPTLRRFNGTVWVTELFDIGNTPYGNMVSTTTQTAINEFDSRIGFGSFRNKIINGEMIVDQKNNGSSQTFIAAAAISYCVDQFYASCTGANITGQKITGTGVYKYSYQFTGTTSNTGSLFGQRIESFNCRDLINKSVTGQVELSSNSITTVTWTAYYANSSDTFSSKTQIATGTLTITSTPTIYNFTFNTGSNSGNGIAIEFTTGALIATKTLTYSGIQLERGNIPTLYETREISDIFRQCQRYLRIIDGVGLVGLAQSASIISLSLPSQLMRSTPVIIMNSTSWTLRQGATGFTGGSSTIIGSNATNGFVTVSINGFSGMTSGYPVIVETAQSNLFLLTSQL